jgi:hypothetical protein
VRRGGKERKRRKGKERKGKERKGKERAEDLGLATHRRARRSLPSAVLKVSLFSLYF